MRGVSCSLYKTLYKLHCCCPFLGYGRVREDDEDSDDDGSDEEIDESLVRLCSVLISVVHSWKVDF